MAENQALLAGLTAMLRGSAKKLQGPGMPFLGGAKGKPPADEAMARGLVELATEEVETGKGSRTKIKTVPLGYQLTEAGYRYLAEAESPKAALEAVLPVLQSIEAKVSPEVVESKYEVALAGSVKKCVDSIAEGFSQLNTTINDALSDFLDEVKESRPTHDQAESMRPLIDFVHRVASNINLAPRPILGAGVPGAPVKAIEPVRPTEDLPPPPRAVERVTQPPPAVEHKALRAEVIAAYEELCRYEEFSDRLVEIPRLYRELQTMRPAVGLKEFHEELMQMRKEGKADLQVLNEVREARHPELAIQGDDRLIYYVIMPK